MNEQSTNSSIVPQPLRSQLEALRPALQNQGIVQTSRKKGNTSFRLRFRHYDPEKGYRVHRSITLGTDDQVAGAVGDLIRQWRAAGETAQWAAAEERHQELTNAKKAREEDRWLCHMIRSVVAMQGGSKWRQRQAVAAYHRGLRDGPFSAVAAQAERFLTMLQVGTDT